MPVMRPEVALSTRTSLDLLFRWSPQRLRGKVELPPNTVGDAKIWFVRSSVGK